MASCHDPELIFPQFSASPASAARPSPEAGMIGFTGKRNLPIAMVDHNESQLALFCTLQLNDNTDELKCKSGKSPLTALADGECWYSARHS
jgi:hypothetical protein